MGHVTPTPQAQTAAWVAADGKAYDHSLEPAGHASGDETGDGEQPGNGFMDATTVSSIEDADDVSIVVGWLLSFGWCCAHCACSCPVCVVPSACLHICAAHARHNARYPYLLPPHSTCPKATVPCLMHFSANRCARVLMQAYHVPL